MSISDISFHTFRNSMPEVITDTDVILIDTHNFTTTSIEALSNGAKEIVPLTSTKGGIANRVTLVAGDNDYELENHPEYMTKHKVNNQIIGIDSWNGSSAVHDIRGRIQGDVNVYLGSLTNAPAIACSLENSDSITFILAGSGGNNPPEDVLTMQCIIQFLYTDLDSIPMVCSLYEQMYITSVLDVYDALYEDKKELGLFGCPNQHAIETASKIGSQTIIPKMNKNGGFIK